MRAIHAAEPLFAWGELEDCPTLTTIRDARAEEDEGVSVARQDRDQKRIDLAGPGGKAEARPGLVSDRD
jgi:hypothetical protein